MIKHIKEFVAFVIVVLFVAYIMLFVSLGAISIYQENNNNPICPQWIKDRHKYHGINGSVEYRGEHYFYRDGKKCKL